jgi:type VI secretion system (T6SS) effector TldE1-like protein
MKLLSIPAGIAALLAALAVGFAWEMRGTPAADTAASARLADHVPKLGDRIEAEPAGLDGQSFAGRFVGADVIEVAESVDAGMQVASADTQTLRLPAIRAVVPTRSLAALSSPAAEPGQSSSSPADVDGRTAIYDIAAHTIYLPDGDKLEAHSGLGHRLDNPHYVSARNLGPTPPNVYALSLREHRFHGVQALRLTPVGDGDMFGRDGILAHTYMLGPKGASNGCLAVRNYPAFLRAYLDGKIERVLVVDHLAPHDRRFASLM